MARALHIGGIVAGYIACVLAIVVGIINQTAGVAGWKFIVFGVAAAVCATVAVIDGARAFPQLGMWKVGGKFRGLSDLAVIIIFVILLIVALIVFIA